MAIVLPVSVVIPTRDRPAMLHALVASICAGTCVPEEIVVADQGAGLSLPERDGDVRIVHLRVPGAGLSRNRNAGIAVATHDVLAFTDDDSVVDPDWLRELHDAILAAPPRTVVTGAVVAGDGEGVAPSLTKHAERKRFSGRITGGDPLFPNNMAIPRAAFDEVGLFDVRLGAGARWFPAAEDNDLGFRLLERGWTVEFVPTARIRHDGVRRGRELLALEWSYGRGQGAFYAKHMRWRDPYMTKRFLVNVVERLGRLPRLLRGDRSAVREASYLAGLLVGAAGWRLRYPRVLGRATVA